MASESQPSSRDRLVGATVRLLRKQGYAASGVSEIARTGHAPMGSFYHYFPDGKEQLAAAAIDAGAAEYAALIERALTGGGTLPEQLSRVAKLTARALQRSGFELGCPVATTALETITTSDTLQDRAAGAFAQWQGIICQRCIDEGVSASQASELAMNVIALIEGAELLARVRRSVDPLDAAENAIRLMATTVLPNATQ